MMKTTMEKPNYQDVVSSDGVQYRKGETNKFAFITIEVNMRNQWAFVVEYGHFLEDAQEYETVDCVRISLEEFPAFVSMMQASGWIKCSS